ncbi:LytTR family DNA-binding domain-containing protein [Ruegeria profundi]|uniref:LytTR family DNA-binding domain-containing protein n=1 Tax=Ruegeria profundi TaxID=1685378 RepID=UPI001CD3F43B|nr:LytTR family DNA-binding domain-containing protein [Ruegeria profundi]MCA0927755.1 LytTR family transcriptional regulator [Ruegeria profundi]
MSLTVVPSRFLAELKVRRVVAGLVFPALLAYTFQPFPKLYLPFSERLIFWFGVVGLALAVIWGSKYVTKTYFTGAYFSWRDVALVALILGLFVPSMWFLSYLLFSYGGQPAPDMLSVAPYGALLATGLVLIRGYDQPSAARPETAAVSPRLVKRLPGSFGGQIFRLTVRDHFVDVVTTEGTFTIRSRFSDAIAEMEPVSGHCTHRSHWVTDTAIDRVEKRGGKTFLRLKNNDLVPVSRKYKPQLEQDGLL